MALPKKKLSRSRRDRRRAHLSLSKQNLTTCPQCKALTRPHSVCPTCGTYRGVQYLAVEEAKPQK